MTRQHPRVAASQLAKSSSARPSRSKTRRWRKPEEARATQSFEVGYEISPRGAKYLALTAKKRPRRRRRIIEAKPSAAPLDSGSVNGLGEGNPLR